MEAQCSENVERLEWNLSAKAHPLFLVPCYLENISRWMTQGWIWVISPFYMYYLFKQETNPHSIGRKLILKTLLLLTNLVLLLGNLVNENIVNTFVANDAILYNTLQICTLLLVLFYMYMERWKGFVTSGVLFVHWSLSVVFSVIPFYSKIYSREFALNTVSFAIFCLAYGIHWLQLILCCFSETINHSKDEEISLKSESSFLERLLFSWVFRLILRGYRRPLTKDDALSMDSKDKAGHLFSNYQKFSSHKEMGIIDCCIKKNTRDLEEDDGAGQSLVARHENEQIPCSKQPGTKLSLIRTLQKMFGWEFFVFHLLTMFRVVCKFTRPQLLGFLLDFLAESPNDKPPLWMGYLMATSLFVVSLTEAVTSVHSMNVAMNLGRRISATLMSALYNKALKIGLTSKKTSSTGEILNLMSVDTSTINDTMIFMGIWIENLLEILLSFYFLYGILGYAVFAGCGTVLLLIPLNVLLASKSLKLMHKIMNSKDERIKLLSEVIEGIKILKLYAWEMTFKNKIIDKRKIELRKLLDLKILESISETSFHVSPFMVIFVVFLTYILINDQPLDAKTVFVSISLFDILRYSVDLLHISVTKNMKCSVAIKRVNTFLNTSNLQEDNVTKINQHDIAVKILDGEFTWDNNSDLKRVCIEIKEGQLVAVVGQVGEGKSSLLSAILGEMTKVKGTVSVKGSIAYVPQQAWIQNGTVEDNIIFGNKMDKERYHRVLQACALIPDLQILPAGDQTEIGDRGVNLSGGQKNRIGLARAVYNNADIYLLDDPFSAVDSHVGSHIFENVMGPTGLLKNKTQILVTHGIQLLPMVDHIFVLSNGEISESGRYEELLNHAGPFAVFLESVLKESKNDDIEETVKEKVLQRLTSLTSTESEDLRLSLNDLTTRSSYCDVSEKETIAKSAESQANHTYAKQYSIISEIDNNTKEMNDILVEEEKVESGKVQWNRFRTYFKMIGLKYSILVVSLYVASEGLSLMGNIWLSKWTDDPSLKFANSTTLDHEEVQQRQVYFLGSYLGFGIGQVFCIVLFGIIYVKRTIMASHTLHAQLLHSTLRCPISFFDTTPAGRIINRFSQDLEAVDNTLPFNFEMVLFCLSSILGVLAAITYSLHWFLLVVIPLGILYFFVLAFFLPTVRQLKRIAAVSRSPIYSYFSETLAGAPVIRAFGKENQVLREFQRRVDEYHRITWNEIAVKGWRSLHLELLGCFVILISSVMAVATKDTITAGMAGLSISYSLNVTKLMNWLVYVFGEFETQTVSVERIAEYIDKESEAELVNESHRPPKGWPSEGCVTISSYSTKYRPHLDLVLKNINLSVRSSEKVGIVGRTGAGKSSLTLALFRLIEPVSGSIEIDGEKLTDLGLHDCRSKLTILPQDPVLFAGTLRMNIDPMNQYTDVEIWNALEHAHLKSYVKSLSLGLESECGEGGGNLSVGQKQMVCLARSLLRKTKVLILDEATASVDLETDELIQKTIREEFRECTVLTIAHRINTVMDYDRIIVLDNGRVMEFDTPEHLLNDRNSLFYELAKTAGIVK